MTSVLKIQLILFIYLDTYIDTYIYTHTEQQLLKHLNHATDYFNHALTHGWIPIFNKLLLNTALYGASCEILPSSVLDNWH